MGFWARLIGRERKNATLDLFREIYGGKASAAGPAVSARSALQVATVLACVRVIANGVAQVPFRVYRERSGSRSPAREHALFPMIYRRPNGWQTSFEFRETLMFHVLLTGNAFVWLGRVGTDRRIATLEPIEPHRVRVVRGADMRLSYEVRADDGSSVTYRADEVWHLRGPSWNAWMGLEAVQLAREAIGLAIATETAHADLHKGGPRIGGVIGMKGKISQAGAENLSALVDRHAQGGDRAGKPIVLDNEAKWQPTQMSGVDAQHLETRKHQIEEICRAFGVMPIMVAHADRTATYASAEQMFIAHVVHTLAPWYERIEESADVNLLSDADRADGFYCKFTPNALMRGSATDRAAFYSAALGAGGSPAWMTQNEVRELEERDALDGGDVLHAPMTAAPAATDSSDTAPEPAP